MLEYVFFHKILAEKFIAKAKDFKISAQLQEQEPAWVVPLSEDMDETVEEKLGDIYDDLFVQDQEMFDQNNESDDGYDAAAIEITLKNGEKTYAQTQPQILGKVLSTLSFAEFNQLIEDVVFAVENPDSRSICQRYRESQKE